MKRWLVEIVIKDWLPDLKEGGRILGYEEVTIVDSGDMFTARRTAFDQFTKRSQYQPKIRKVIESNNLSPSDWCAPAAVVLAENVTSIH